MKAQAAWATLAGWLASSLAACGAMPSPPSWGVALEGNPIRQEQIASFTRGAGLPPKFVVFFQQWPEYAANGEFPLASVEAIARAGAMPVLTWEPMFYRTDGAEIMVPAAAIMAGDYDAYIERFAQAAASWGRPIVLRFAHEMNLNRYHWGGTREEYGPESPARFRGMWHHVVDVFRRAKATNVRWAFCPNCEPVPGAGDPATWNSTAAYFPGNEYVDVLGMDGYNWGDTQTPEKNGWRSSWRSFAGIFGLLREELRQIAPGKPLYVFETASAASGGDKRRWIADMAATATEWKLDGVAWFEANKEVDWRLLSRTTTDAVAPLQLRFGAK